MKKFIIIAVLAGFSLSMTAQDSGFGVGVVFGEPLGLSLKTWLSSKTAVDGAVAWSTRYDFLYLHADMLVHNYNLIDVSDGELPLYFGLGAKLGFGDGVLLGARIPVGLDYQFGSAPLDVFVEIVPGVNIVPEIDFDLNGGIGIRFWF